MSPGAAQQLLPSPRPHPILIQTKLFLRPCCHSQNPSTQRCVESLRLLDPSPPRSGCLFSAPCWADLLNLEEFLGNSGTASMQWASFLLCQEQSMSYGALGKLYHLLEPQFSYQYNGVINVFFPRLVLSMKWNHVGETQGRAWSFWLWFIYFYGGEIYIRKLCKFYL